MAIGWIVLLVIVGLSNIVLGLLVGIRDWKRPVNQAFVVLSVSVSVWVFGIAGFLGSSSNESAFIFAKIFYAAPLVLVVSLMYFAHLFPDRSHMSRRALLLPLVVSIPLFIPLLINRKFITDHLSTIPSGRVMNVNETEYLVYALVVVSLFVAAFIEIYRQSTKLQGLYKEQTRWFLVAGVITALAGGWFNIVQAHWLHDYRYIWVGPLATTLYVLACTISIIRHRMFDIRLAAVRTLAYAMALLAMSAVYFSLAYIVTRIFFRDDVNAGVSISPINIVLALILAFMFQPIRKFFDKITNKIFYRDRYNTSEFITRLGRVLTNTTKLKDVLSSAGHEISATLKTNGYIFLIYRDNHTDIVVGQGVQTDCNNDEHELFRRLSTINDGKVVLAQQLDHKFQQSEQTLYIALSKRNIGLALPLIGADGLVGILMLGEQMSSGYTKRDVDVLETIADELVIAIQNARSVQVVRDLNTHLEQRVASATKELRESNDRLMQLDATKDEFVSMASHQLRTPLTSIKGYISMVLDGDVGKITPEQRKLLEEAFTSSERMVHLIGDFLNVSRLQTGKFMIEFTDTDICDLVRQEVDAIQQIAAAHGTSVQFKKRGRIPKLHIDENKIRQVVMNFIDNAIYYSPDSSDPINVSLCVEDGNVVLRVIDNGMGVPKAEQKQLFTKFFRAKNARNQRPDGTGVGLFLAKKVIDGHGGKLIFESTEGQGSTFGFRLPIKKLTELPVRKEPAT